MGVITVDGAIDEAVEVRMYGGGVVSVGERVVHYTRDCHSDSRDFAGGGSGGF